MAVDRDYSGPSGGRWRKLARDVGVYAAGTFGAKVLTFLMVPLYTYFIPDTGAFGYFDICLSAAFLLSPVATLDLRDGVFRYLLDAPDAATRRRVVSAASRTVARSLAVAVALLVAASCFVAVPHRWLALLLLVSVAVNELYAQLVRGLGSNRLFAAMGVATAVLIVLLSVWLVGWLRWGIEGIFVANAAARLLPVAVVEAWRGPLRKHFSTAALWRPMARELLRYTLPLLPAMVVWWVLSFGDRWFVLWAAGADANGVYAVAARLTGVVYTFTTVMQQAWQETAIMQYASDDRDRFFTQIFTAFVHVTCLVVIVYVTVLHLCYGWIVEAHYRAGAVYLLPMAVAAGVYALGTFLEMGYQCSRQTARALPSSVLAGVANVVLNLLLAPRWGVWGVVASSLLAFTLFTAYRWVDVRRYFALRPGPGVLAPPAALLALGAAIWLGADGWRLVLVAAAAALATVATLPRPLYNKLRKKALLF